MKAKNFLIMGILLFGGLFFTVLIDLSDTAKIIFGIAIIFLSGVVSFVFGLKFYAKKKLIEDVPTCRIRSIPMGLVEVYGEVVPIGDKLLRSPLTQNECVYYRYKIEELSQYGRYSRWVVIKSGEDSMQFFLKDETGAVLVDPRGAEVDIPSDFFFKTGIGKDLPENVKQFLLANDISFTGVLGMNKNMKFTEYFIAPKDKLYILGTAGDNPHMAEGWAQRGIEDMMIQKCDNIFYISDKSEKEILKSIRLKSLGLVIFGSLLIVIGVACAFLFLKSI